jgi:hypothetical protein
VGALTQVARLIGCRYQTLLEYRKYPGFPPDRSPSGRAKFDVGAIRAFVHAAKSAHNFGGFHKPVLNEREQAYADRAKLMAEREKFKLAIDMAEYVKRDQANRQIESANAVVRRELRKALEFELPPRVEMMRAPEIRKIMVQKLKDISAHLPNMIMSVNGNGHH